MNEGKIEEADLLDMIAVRYERLGFLIFRQVRAFRKYDSRIVRQADAIAFSHWASRGIFLVGFEVKTDRRDWLNELKNPSKADDVACKCREWWMVAPPEIIKPDELPENWGLLVAKGGKLYVEKKAASMNPEPPNLELLALLARRLFYRLPRDEKIIQAPAKEISEEVSDLKDRLDGLRKQVKEFEEASGVKIDWRAKEIGGAVKIVLEQENSIEQAKRSVQRLRDAADRLEEALNDIKKNEG